MSKLLDAVRDSMRLKRYSSSTIESYTNWILRFILFILHHNRRHPREMSKVEISAFLSYLANEKHISGSTQNQALQAILYLYKDVLQIEIGNLDFARAVKDKRLPTILTRQEVQNILAAMPDNELRLMAQLCYGSGLRLFECVRLCVKDVDLPSQRITVRDTKSNRDRHTILPSKLIAPLGQHITRVTPLHQSDIANGIGVHLPDALAVKYKNANREIERRIDNLKWFWAGARRNGGQRGDRARLHDEEVLVAHRPFNIHRLTEQLLDLRAEADQFCDLRRCQRGLRPSVCGHRFFARPLGQSHRHHFLVGDLLRCHRARLLVDNERVGRDVPAHNRFAQAPRRVDDHLVARTRDRIRGEENACCIRRHELLHHDGETDIFGVDPLARAIADGARGPERCPTALDRRQHMLIAAHVEKSFLLTRERHLRQIFCRRRRAHGDGGVVGA